MTDIDGNKYWAFISYSSKDSKWGERIHRRLENYNIPLDLQGQELFDGAVLGKYLKPIFRDRDELAGAADLGEAINQALKKSRFLVVLCSRSAAVSDWVNKEILEFKALGKGKYILALILDGEPNGTMKDRPGDECFPPSLRYPEEPIAGDLRREGDGHERGFLKILAGIAQLDYDKLYRRHERQRVRRSRYRAMVAVAGIALFASLAGVAVRQRDIAEARHLQAESALSAVYANEADRSFSAGLVREAAFQALYSLKAKPGGMGIMVGLDAVATLWPEIATIENGKPQVFGGSYGWVSQLVLPLGEDRLCAVIGDGKAMQADLLARTPMTNLFTTHESTDKGLNLELDVDNFGYMLLSPDAKVVATNSPILRLWDARTYRLISGLDYGTQGDWAHRFVFSPDGSRLAISGEDRIRILDTANLAVLTTMPIHDSLADILVFSLDGKSLACASRNGAVTIWDPITGRQLAHVKPSGISWDALAVSPDGRCIAMAARGMAVHFWIADAGSTFQKIETLGKEVTILEFSPDGRTLATGMNDGRVMLWDTLTLSLRGTLVGHRDGITAILFPADGLTLITGSSDGSIKLWERRQTMRISSYGTATDALPITAFFSGAHKLLLVSEHGATLWDLGTGTIIRQLEGSEESSSIACSSDGSLFTAGFLDGRVRVWDLPSGTMLGTLDGLSSTVGAIGLSPDGQFLAASDFGQTIVWSMPGKKVERRIESSNNNALVLSADGSRLLTCSNTEISQWDLATGIEDFHFSTDHDFINSLNFSKDGRTIMAGFSTIDGLEPHVDYIDPVSGKIVRSIQISGRNVRPSPSGQTMIGEGKDGGSLLLYDLDSGQLVREKDLEGGVITSLAYSPDGMKIAVGHSNGTATILPSESSIGSDALIHILSDYVDFAFPYYLDGTGHLLPKDAVAFAESRLEAAEQGAISIYRNGGRDYIGLFRNLLARTRIDIDGKAQKD